MKALYIASTGMSAQERNVEVIRSGQRPSATRLMVGDHCSIDLE